MFHNSDPENVAAGRKEHNEEQHITRRIFSEIP